MILFLKHYRLSRANGYRTGRLGKGINRCPHSPLLSPFHRAAWITGWEEGSHEYLRVEALVIRGRVTWEHHTWIKTEK